MSSQTRGVFGLVLCPKEEKIFLSGQSGNWKLPGGCVQEGEDDAVALARHMKEAGISVRVCGQVGLAHVFKEDTVVGYLCDPMGSIENRPHCFISKKETKNLSFDVFLRARRARMLRVMSDGFAIMEPSRCHKALPRLSEYFS